MDPLEELKSLPEDRRAAWLQQNSAALDAVAIEQIVNYFNAMGTSRDVVELGRQLMDRKDVAPEVQSQITDRTEDLVAAGVSQFDAANQARAEAGVEEGAEEDPFAGQETNLPREVLEAVGRDLSEEAAADLLEWIQQDYPGIQDLQTAVDAGLFRDPTLQAAASVFGLQDEPVERGLVFNNNRGEEVAIRDVLAQAAQETFGIDDRQLVQSARLAEVYGFNTAAGETAWQPFLALLQATGLQFKTGSESSARAGDLNKMLTRQQELRRELNRPGLPQSLLQSYQQELRQINAALAQDVRTESAPVLSRRELGLKWKQGMDKYGSETLAFFHSIDEGLASRMGSQGMENLTEQDTVYAASLMAKAGVYGESPEDFASVMFQLGFVDPAAREFARAQARAGGGGGRTVLKPDPVAIRQAARDMYQQLYLTEPSEQQLDQLASQISGSITGAPDDVNVDGAARAREAVEGMPEYDKLYGQKGNLSEEQYQGMMVAGQRSMLGDELAGNEAARLGMQGGKYQTAVGAAMGTTEAWDNSTFLGRLAGARRAVERTT